MQYVPRVEEILVIQHLRITRPESRRFFTVVHSLYKVSRNGSIGIKGFNNSKKQMLIPVGLDLMQEIIAC